jgi:anti-sigma B factor antagonist
MNDWVFPVLFVFWVHSVLSFCDQGVAIEFYYHDVDREILVLRADGGLNADTADAFVEQLESLIAAGLNKIIIDCTKLDYISSYGVGVLLRLHKKLKKEGGDVKIAAAKSIVLKALTILRMATMFDVYEDVDRARLAFRKTG